MKKQSVKFVSALLIGIMLAGETAIPASAAVEPLYQNQNVLQKVYSNNDSLKEGVSNLLGSLDTEVTEEERTTVNKMMSILSDIEAEREEKNQFEATKEEEDIAFRLCAYLDGLTLKYINGAKQVLDYGSFFGNGSELPENNVIIKNIKKTLSAKDYKKIVKLYNQYIENEKDSIYNKMYEILSKYKKLDAQAVCDNIIGVNMPMKGQFEINHKNLSVSYLNPQKYGLSKLSKKQVKKYKKVWDEVKKILPANYFSTFKEFDIASDGKYGTMAYVMQMDATGKTWKMCIDPADMKNKTDFALTVVHEFSHYVSLNHRQVNYFSADENLMPSFEQYWDYEVLANQDSYLNLFYQKFWSDVDADWKADPDNSLFYVRHYKEFVTEYAATQCAEDFAETFSFYVLGKEDATKEQEEKMAFFDQFPELKQMKQEISNNIEENNYFE